MQAIITRYHGPTTYRGSRISARCDAGRLTIPYPYGLSGEAVHRAAAEALCAKLGWSYMDNEYRLVGGAFPPADRDGYAFVFVLQAAE